MTDKPWTPEEKEKADIGAKLISKDLKHVKTLFNHGVLTELEAELLRNRILEFGHHWFKHEGLY